MMEPLIQTAKVCAIVAALIIACSVIFALGGL